MSHGGALVRAEEVTDAEKPRDVATASRAGRGGKDPVLGLPEGGRPGDSSISDGERVCVVVSPRFVSDGHGCTGGLLRPWEGKNDQK